MGRRPHGLGVDHERHHRPGDAQGAEGLAQGRLHVAGDGARLPGDGRPGRPGRRGGHADRGRGRRRLGADLRRDERVAHRGQPRRRGVLPEAARDPSRVEEVQDARPRARLGLRRGDHHDGARPSGRPTDRPCRDDTGHRVPDLRDRVRMLRLPPLLRAVLQPVRHDIVRRRDGPHQDQRLRGGRDRRI